MRRAVCACASLFSCGVWRVVPQPDRAYAFSRPLPGGTTLTLAVNISGEPVSFALPGGRTVALPPHGFDVIEK